MATNREFNWQGQQRVDIPHLRMVESAVRYDFDALAYSMCGDNPYIINGFNFVGTALNVNASRLTIKTAGAKMFHHLATDSGAVFVVPTDRANETIAPGVNTKVEGSWILNSYNYLGLDLVKRADSTTEDSLKLQDPGTENEIGQRIPLARTLDYKFVISSLEFSYNKYLCPLYVIFVDAQGKITEIRDARPLWGRLDPGGSNIADYKPFGWPGGRVAVEDAANCSTGDKSITSMKSWMNAVNTRIWEIGGGQYWYSPTADRNVFMTYGSVTFTETGEAFRVAASNVLWKGVSFVFDNSPEESLAVADQTTALAGLTDLADGECIYVDLDRTSTTAITAQKGALATLGMSARPGQRHVMIVRVGSFFYVKGSPWPIGYSGGKIATTLTIGSIKTTINANGDDASYPVAVGLANSVTGAYSATCGGISHNLGVLPTPTLLLGSGPLFIGGDIGDEHILIQPWTGFKTLITADTDATEAVCIAQSSLGSPETTKIAKFGTLLSGDIVNRADGVVEDNTVAVAAIDGNGAIGMARTDSVFDATFAYPSIPRSPDTENFGNIKAKQFLRSSKVWQQDVAAVFDNAGSFFTGWTNTSPGVWQQDSTNALSSTQFFGVTPTLGMRVLVWFQADNAQNTIWDKYQWIYTITALGGDGNHAILTRATDANTSGKVFKGCAVYNSGGGSLGDSCFMITHPAPLVLNTSGMTISLTNTQTRDQYCIMWHDGSYTVIAEGPFYNHTL